MSNHDHIAAHKGRIAAALFTLFALACSAGDPVSESSSARLTGSEDAAGLKPEGRSFIGVFDYRASLNGRKLNLAPNGAKKAMQTKFRITAVEAVREVQNTTVSINKDGTGFVRGTELGENINDTPTRPAADAMTWKVLDSSLNLRLKVQVDGIDLSCDLKGAASAPVDTCWFTKDQYCRLKDRLALNDDRPMAYVCELPGSSEPGGNKGDPSDLPPARGKTDICADLTQKCIVDIRSSSCQVGKTAAACGCGGSPMAYDSKETLEAFGQACGASFDALRNLRMQLKNACRELKGTPSADRCLCKKAATSGDKPEDHDEQDDKPYGGRETHRHYGSPSHGRVVEFSHFLDVESFKQECASPS